MRRLGIYSRLDQVFEAPFAVKEVLISQFGLEYSYIGSKETDQRADQVSQIGIRDFWTPENHYRWIKSRYGPNVSAMVETVNGSRLLSNMEPGEVDKLKDQKRELEEAAYSLVENLNTLKVELRNTENEGAELERQYVCEHLFFLSGHSGEDLLSFS
nr:structural maintenance of chromosomes protein 5 [Ipomoea batatas]GMD67523.1 structural maintenance of chromosomes protein 5 [Ipomoea batatas]